MPRPRRRRPAPRACRCRPARRRCRPRPRPPRRHARRSGACARHRRPGLHLGKKARAHSTGLPRLPRQVGTTIARPSTGSKAAISRSISAALTRGMSPRQTTAPVDVRGQGGEAGPQRGAQPLGDSRGCGEAHLAGRAGPGGPRALVAEHDDDRRRPARPAQPPRRGAPSACRRPRSSSLFGPPMRRDWPAARTSAATPAGAGRGCAFARLRPRGDLGQQAADAHAHDVAAGDRQPAAKPLQHPVEAVELWRAAAAGQAQHRPPSQPRQQQQVAGIDRHAEMLDRAAGSLDAGGQDVVAVGDGRGAGDQHHVAAGRHGRADGRGHGGRGRARSASRRRARRATAARRSRVIRTVLSSTFAARSAARSGSAAARQGRNGATRSSGPSASAVRQRSSSARRDGERDDLDGRHHLPRLDHGMLGQRGERHRLVDPVEAVDPVAIDDQQSARRAHADWRAR